MLFPSYLLLQENIDDVNFNTESINQLKTECEQIWTDIHMVHSDIQKAGEVQTTANVKNPMLAICQAKEKRLQAEVDALRQRPLNVLPQRSEVLKAVVKDELQTSLKQLEETLSDVKIRKKELQDELNRFVEELITYVKSCEDLQSPILVVAYVVKGRVWGNTIKILRGPSVDSIQCSFEGLCGGCTANFLRTEIQLQQQQELHQEMLSKMEGIGRGADVRLIREAKQKHKKMERYSSELERKLTEFLAEHFPLPTPDDDLGKGKRKRRTSGQTTIDQYVDGKHFVSLRRIIRRMAKQQFESPHDPYIVIEDSYWPPYLELLLRCGVIVKNPQNSQYIKLRPFHL
ncbi:centromere protein K-like [Glandiceps talaboti]